MEIYVMLFKNIFFFFFFEMVYQTPPRFLRKMKCKIVFMLSFLDYFKKNVDWNIFLNFNVIGKNYNLKL